MNIDNKQTDKQNKKTSLGESIAQIKQTRKALEQKKTLLQINQIGQIGKISQSDSTESKQEIAKAIKQLDELSAQLQKPN